LHSFYDLIFSWSVSLPSYLIDQNS
jgi:hypothetical protein